MSFHNLDAYLFKQLRDTFMVLMRNQRSRSLASFDFSPPSSLPRRTLLVKGIPCENPQTTLGKAKERLDVGERARCIFHPCLYLQLYFFTLKRISLVFQEEQEYVSSSSPLGNLALISTLELVTGKIAITCPQISVTLLRFPEESFLGRMSYVMGRRRGVDKYRALERLEHGVCNWGAGEMRGEQARLHRQQLGCGAASASSMSSRKP